jgi:DNA-binding GntR family transcriptional regulator
MSSTTEQPGSPRPVAISSVTTVQHAALGWLRHQIATGAFEPGARLRQEVLAREAGVSVPPIREALKTLEAEGQVVYVPRRGYCVANLSLAEVEEAYRIRDLLETEAIHRAVGALDTSDLDRMRSAIKDMERAHRDGDVVALTQANRTFHFTIFDGADMPRMAEMIRILWESTDRYRSLYYSTAAHRHRVNDEHREIMTAVASGDASTAARLLREHRDHALHALRDALVEAPRATESPDTLATHHTTPRR